MSIVRVLVWSEESFLDRTTIIWCYCPATISLWSKTDRRCLCKHRAMLVRALSGSYDDLAIKKGKIWWQDTHASVLRLSKGIIRVENKLVVFYPIFPFSYTHLKSTTQYEVCCTWDVLLCISGVTSDQNHKTKKKFCSVPVI